MSETSSPTYRVGQHRTRNIYRGDEFIGVCTHENNFAQAIVNKLNSPEAPWGMRMFVGAREEQDVRTFLNNGDRLAVFFDPADAALVAEALNRAGGQGE